MTEAEKVGPESWYVIGAKWLAAQGTSTVLLAGILYWIYQATNYAMDTAIPAHLGAIQAGYKEIQNETADQVKQLQEENHKQVQWITEKFLEERNAERQHSREMIEAIRSIGTEIKNNK